MEAAYSAAVAAAASLVGCWPALGATDPTTPGAGAIVMGITRSLAIPKTILDQIYSPRWLNPKGEGGRTLQRQFGSHNSEDTFGWQRRCYRFRVDTSGDADPTTESTWWSSKWLLKQILIELNWCLLSWNVSVLVGALLVLAVNDDVLIGGLHCHFIGTELRHVNHHLTSTKKKKKISIGDDLKAVKESVNLERVLIIFDAGDEFSEFVFHTTDGRRHSHSHHTIHHVHCFHIHPLHPRYGA